MKQHGYYLLAYTPEVDRAFRAIWLVAQFQYSLWAKTKCLSVLFRLWTSIFFINEAGVIFRGISYTYFWIRLLKACRFVCNHYGAAMIQIVLKIFFLFFMVIFVLMKIRALISTKALQIYNCGVLLKDKSFTNNTYFVHLFEYFFNSLFWRIFILW